MREETLLGQVADGVGLPETQGQGTGEGEGEALELSDDGRRVAVDHEEREHEHVEVQLGSEQDAGQRRQHRPEGPAQGRDPRRTGAVEGGQVAVVDDRSHGHPGSRPVEEQAQEDGDGAGHADLYQLVPRHVHAGDAEAVAGEELGQGPRIGRLPEREGKAHEEQEQAERHHQGHARVRPPDVAHQRALDDSPEQRRQHEEHGDEGEWRRPMGVHAQLPVDEGHDHPHGPVGEVEDPRGRVGHDQAAGRHGIDRSRDDSGDREGEELGHVSPP